MSAKPVTGRLYVVKGDNKWGLAFARLKPGRNYMLDKLVWDFVLWDPGMQVTSWTILSRSEEAYFKEELIKRSLIMSSL